MASSASHGQSQGRNVNGGNIAEEARGGCATPNTQLKRPTFCGEDAKQQSLLPKTPNGVKDGTGRRIISFNQGDPENPVNWSTLKKSLIVLAGVLAQINSTLGSALPSGATSYLARSFHIDSQEQLVLPISLYLVGYVLGPVLFGPLSESYGRRVIIVSTFTFFTLFTLACAVAPSWPVLLVFRLIVGINASSAISVTGGLYADMYDDPVTRGRAMALFMASTMFGPLLGPVISGFLSPISWRWTFWAGLIIAGVSFFPLALVPETYAPVILKRRARRMRKETGDQGIYAPIELEKRGAKQMLTVTLLRPLKMLFTEAVVGFTCLYLALAYAIFYLFFEAYPLIFQGIYRMNTGISSLTFLPIGIGACIACALFLYYDHILHRAKARHAHWSTIEEYRRLPLACLGGPCIVASLFWLGWTSSPGIHWIVPTVAGIPFGIGYLLIFMALLNYLTDAYEIFAASAMAASTCSRCLGGALLPFAAGPMYGRLGIAWASSLLGFLSLGMCAIPFVFIKYGDRIRGGSKFCQELAERKRREKEEGEGRAEAEGEGVDEKVRI